jgi:large subunit ribosomal protein L19
MNQLEKLEETFLKANAPQLKIGQTVKVYLKIVEGEKERIQVFEGIIIGMKGVGHRQTFTVRKISYSVGVERIFPLHSPSISRVEVVRDGDVSRAKLYFLRERSGRSARLSEKKREIVAIKKGGEPALIPIISAEMEDEQPVPVQSSK